METSVQQGALRPPVSSAQLTPPVLRTFIILYGATSVAFASWAIYPFWTSMGWLPDMIMGGPGDKPAGVNLVEWRYHKWALAVGGSLLVIGAWIRLLATMERRRGGQAEAPRRATLKASGTYLLVSSIAMIVLNVTWLPMIAESNVHNISGMVVEDFRRIAENLERYKRRDGVYPPEIRQNPVWSDPFVMQEQSAYRYYSNGQAWMLQSAAPDGRYDAPTGGDFLSRVDAMAGKSPLPPELEGQVYDPVTEFFGRGDIVWTSGGFRSPETPI